MKIKLYIFLIFILFATKSSCQSIYEKKLDELLSQLNNSKQGCFKQALFLVESAFDDKLILTDYQKKIDYLKQIVELRIASDSLDYTKSDKQLIKKYAAIFRTICDTTYFKLSNSNNFLRNLPLTYDFDDIFGAKHWENMFVTKLLATRKGNCHSMPYLYKILCEALGVPCALALAPNHIYIKHQSEKAGWYNTELTSASFPMDAWLMASGYITLEAIQNGIYMDALDDKQCIALCVLDLAKGFDRKYPDNDGTFIIKCCDLTLEHFPKGINAMLFKAETRKKQVERLMKMLHIDIATVPLHPQGKIWWEEMNLLYTQIHRLGYRTMPEQMYVDWLSSLQKEKEKYANKQMMDINKK
ncbi:MAG: hypothetical protein RLZZ628_2156 [Bacteroidota bacterium]|jgi:hypothetical protein